MFYISIPKQITAQTSMTDKRTSTVVFEQKVILEHPDKLCGVELSLLVPNGQDGKPRFYEVGEYDLHPDSIQGGKYGRADFRVVVGKRREAAKRAPA